jgi:hypothetical protein
MNVLTIYLPRRKLPVASNLRIVKTAVAALVPGFHKRIPEDVRVSFLLKFILDLPQKNFFTSYLLGSCNGSKDDRKFLSIFNI